MWVQQHKYWHFMEGKIKYWKCVIFKRRKVKHWSSGVTSCKTTWKEKYILKRSIKYDKHESKQESKLYKSKKKGFAREEGSYHSHKTVVRQVGRSFISFHYIFDQNIEFTNKYFECEIIVFEAFVLLHRISGVTCI